MAKRRACMVEGVHHYIDDSDLNLHTIDAINEAISGTFSVTTEFEFHLRHVFCSALHLKSNYAIFQISIIHRIDERSRRF